MNSDNQFGKCCSCPALMNDARLFTNYNLNSKLNSSVKKINKFDDEHQYRSYLQNNGDNIRKSEMSYLESNGRCNFNLMK